MQRAALAVAGLMILGLLSAHAANFAVNAEDLERYAGFPTSTLPCKFVPGGGGGLNNTTPGANPCPATSAGQTTTSGPGVIVIATTSPTSFAGQIATISEVRDGTTTSGTTPTATTTTTTTTTTIAPAPTDAPAPAAVPSGGAAPATPASAIGDATPVVEVTDTTVPPS